jgi:large subunit ribosomal protein L31
MRKGIHPQYYPEATVTCSCGNTWVTGSTQPSIRTDVCSKCHPFYTGEQRIVDTAGQVDRFMKRLDRYTARQADADKRLRENRKKAEQRFLRQQLIALDLSDRVFQTLSDANVITVGDLVQRLEKDQKGLLELEGLGQGALTEIQTKLQEARTAYFAEVV